MSACVARLFIRLVLVSRLAAFLPNVQPRQKIDSGFLLSLPEDAARHACDWDTFRTLPGSAVDFVAIFLPTQIPTRAAA